MSSFSGTPQPATMTREPRDRDFLVTREGMFFCVTGYLHPSDRVTAYLKYSPAPQGKWKSGEIAYRRELPYYHVSQVSETIRFLEKNYPDYVADCPVRNIRFSMIPRQAIARYFLPEQRLQEILATPGDSLEEEVRNLALLLSECAGIPVESLGIGGSILIGLHNPEFSDIDMLVYGLDNAHRVRDALKNERCPGIRRPDQAFIQRWAGDVSQRFSLSRPEASELFTARRWNYGFLGDRYFSLHPTRTGAEINERYGEHIYRATAPARITAVINDAREALYQPAVYEVEQVRVLDGSPLAAGVRRIVSYEGLFRDVADQGQTVEAYGLVETDNGQPNRLVVGSRELQGKCYVKSSEQTAPEVGMA